MDYQARTYKKERDEAREKLKRVEYKLNSHEKTFQRIIEMINEYCEDEILSFDDFMFYWDKMVESNEGMFAEQFGTLIMTAKMFFGEELHKMRVDETRAAETAHKARLKDRAMREQRKKEYKMLLAIRGKERSESIKKREELLDRIFVSHSVLADLHDEDIPHAKALLVSGHLAVTFWLGRLKILKREDVPPEHEEEYYECRDHEWSPYTGGSFYSMMARMAAI